MANGNKSLERAIRRNIYAMKRQYGAKIDVYRIVSSETDHLTGEKTVIKEVHPVRRAPVLPSRMKRDVTQTISIISADKQFVYGGFYDASKREVIIDSRDLPNDYEIKPEDYVVFNGERWDVIGVEKFEYDTGWVLTVKNLPGMPAYEIQDLLITQDLSLGQEASTTGAYSLLSSLGLAGNFAVVKTVGGLPINQSGLNLTQSVSVQKVP